MGPHSLVVPVTPTEARPDSGLRRVLRGGVVNMAGAVVSAALNLALIIAITRAFSQETAGLLFSATSVFLIMAAVANLGAPDGLVYFIARMRVFGRHGGVPALLRLALGPAVLAACLVSVLLVVFARPLADALGPEEATTYLRILALFLPFAVLTDSALAATRAHHDMSVTVLVDKVGRPLAQLGLVAMIALSGSAGLLALAWAGPYLPAAVLAWFWLGRIVRRTAPEEPREPADAPATAGTPAEEERVTPAGFWSFSLPRALGGVAQMGVQRGGVVMVALLNGLTGAAVFTAATRIMVVGQFGTQAVLYAAQPRFAELLAARDHAAVRALYQAGTSWLVCLTWPLYLSALVFAPEVMKLFGAEYSTGVMALVIVCTGQLAAQVLGMGDLILTMTGRTGLNLLNNVMSLLANVAVCVLLVPSHGAAGAAVALVAAVLVRKLLPLWQLRSLVLLHPFSRPVLIATGSALVWFGALPLLLDAVTGGGLPVLAATVLAGAGGHLYTVWRTRAHLQLRR
ncbi:polysaccharide biosynthesis C-terminal domain-containing protein [Nocardiopsis exhalans]|uniref:Polysaccharide biosynthesis C-terminal domain-containing protein n=1 Tax=Nocardiopsis exhalans TaxID=163604 RepID=A0ABY5D753_9ACTN|nr:polysaccharide biosynthesis C-terminal domain-containing protein [Nocardiopsis exhalans]USY19308.1 polysaccharide biosynthesis C-terminal domain-containing protein [Nocardiopsis exhalans]